MGKKKAIVIFDEVTNLPEWGKKQVLEAFENMKQGAELKALSSESLERPLTDREFAKMMELKDKILN